jgi:alpha/beta superfamily hydrolase
VTERIRIPGARDVRASLDSADTAAGEAESVVVACPPHPQMRGDRHDSRLQGVSDAVTGEGIDCLRFDYGPWDEGRGERTDVRNALAWAAEPYEQVGLFGFSFGGAVALLAAVPDDEWPTPDVLSALAPAAQVADDGDVVAALDRIECPVQVVYGERDDTADWEPVVERARALGYEVVGLPADHFFVGQQAKAADRVCAFLCGHLG